MAAVFLLFALVATAAWRFLGWSAALAIAFFFLAGMLVAANGIAVVAGVYVSRRMRAFLESTRPMLRWTYDPETWETVRRRAWAERSTDWPLQFGCLFLLCSGIGILVGVSAGAYVLLWSAGGILFGLLLGATVAALWHLVSRLAHERSASEPGEVALAPGEVFFDGLYLRVDGRNRILRSVEIREEEGLRLLVSVFKYGKRVHAAEVPIPPRLLAAVEAALPALRAPIPPPEAWEIPDDESEEKEA